MPRARDRAANVVGDLFGERIQAGAAVIGHQIQAVDDVAALFKKRPQMFEQAAGVTDAVQQDDIDTGAGIR